MTSPIWKYPSNNGRFEKLALVAGQIGGLSVVHKFGANSSVGNGSTEDIWNAGSAYTGWLTTADTIRVGSGGNANDHSTGTNARTITISGLDSNWAVATATLTLNGTGTSAASSSQFFRINRAYVETVGAYGTTNAAAITIETSSGSTVAVIPAGLGQTEMSMYTIPANKTGYMTHLSCEVQAAQAMDIKMYQRQNADAFTAPMSAKRLVTEFRKVTVDVVRAFDSYIMFPAKTDLWLEAVNASGAASEVSVDYDLILADN